MNKKEENSSKRIELRINHGDNMNNNKLYKFALISAVISTIGWVAYIVGATGTPDLSAAETGQQFFQAMLAAKSTYLIYGWGGVFGALLSIPYVIAFYEAVKTAGSIRLVVVASAVIGAVMTAIGFLSNTISVAYFMLPDAIEAGAEQLDMMRIALNFATDASEGVWWVGSFLLYGIGTWMFAWYALKHTSTAKWINYVGLVGGLSGIIWLRHFLPFLKPLILPLSLVNILAISIWSIAFSVSSIRSEE